MAQDWQNVVLLVPNVCLFSDALRVCTIILFKRKVKVPHRNIFNFLRHLSDIMSDLMTDVVKLNCTEELNGERL